MYLVSFAGFLFYMIHDANGKADNFFEMYCSVYSRVLYVISEKRR